MSIKTAEELAGMRAAGLVVGRTLEAMKRAVRPGVTTAEVDEAGAKMIREHGARPAPTMVYGFPGANLISVNNEVVHGIPGARRLGWASSFRYSEKNSSKSGLRPAA